MLVMKVCLKDPHLCICEVLWYFQSEFIYRVQYCMDIFRFNSFISCLLPAFRGVPANTASLNST